MDQAVIDQKLESLRRCVVRLQARCPESAEAIDWQIVFRLCHTALDDFRDFARAFAF